MFENNHSSAEWPFLDPTVGGSGGGGNGGGCFKPVVDIQFV